MKNQTAGAVRRLERSIGYHRIRRWISRNDGVISWKSRWEDQRWLQRRLRLIRNLWTVCWHCQNGKQCTTRGSCHYSRSVDAWADERDSNSGNIFWKNRIQIMNSKRPLRLLDSPPFCFDFHVLTRQTLGTKITKGLSTEEVCLSCTTRLHIISCSLSDPGWTSKKRCMYDTTKHQIFWQDMEKDVHTR